jgi:hypothetical protein
MHVDKQPRKKLGAPQRGPRRQVQQPSGIYLKSQMDRVIPRRYPRSRGKAQTHDQQQRDHAREKDHEHYRSEAAPEPVKVQRKNIIPKSARICIFMFLLFTGAGRVFVTHKPKE